MLSFSLSTPAYLKRLFMAFLMLPCLVAAEQAQQPFTQSFAQSFAKDQQDPSGATGMLVAEHYTLSGDSLRLRHSRELDLTLSPAAPDLSLINAHEWGLNLPLATGLATAFATPVITTSAHAYVLARAPPPLHT